MSDYLRRVQALEIRGLSPSIASNLRAIGPTALLTQLERATDDDLQRLNALDQAALDQAAANKEPDWQPGRWWRVTAPDGSLWCETSVEDEAREHARPGDRIERQWVRTEAEWRQA